MEALFQADFAGVRVHVGQEALVIGAFAFTHGSDLYFAPGQYNPNLSHGQRLIGHELTHVLQQKAGRVRNPFGSGIAVVQDPGLEAEAERMGLCAVMMSTLPQTGCKPGLGKRTGTQLLSSRPPTLHPQIPCLRAPSKFLQAKRITGEQAPMARSGQGVLQAVLRQTTIEETLPVYKRVDTDFYLYLTLNGIKTEVARLELEEYDDGRIWLIGVSTPQRFRRRGYASMLMRVARGIYGEIYVSSAGEIEHKKRGDDPRYLADSDGEAFVKGCIKKGILKSEWWINPFADEEESWDEEDYDDDTPE